MLLSQTRFFRSRWMWMGASAAFLIFLPNLVWLIRHDFPFLDDNNVRKRTTSRAVPWLSCWIRPCW
jgi:hypothetical protein